jgi:hypothetical protein
MGILTRPVGFFDCTFDGCSREERPSTGRQVLKTRHKLSKKYDVIFGKASCKCKPNTLQDLMQPESVSRTNVLMGSGNRLLLWYGPCKWSTILTLINSEIQLLIKYKTKLLEIQRSLIRRASHAIPSTDNLQYSEGRAYL